MRPTTRMNAWRMIALGSTCAALASCTAILDLQEPPDDPSDAATPPLGDATVLDAMGPPAPQPDGSPHEDAAATDGATATNEECVPLDAGDGAASYRSFEQMTIDADGGMAVELFDIHSKQSNAPSAYGGSVYDGSRYIYFTSHGFLLVRFDTTGSFADPNAWATFNLTRVIAPPAMLGFEGAVFDGHYVYLVPSTFTSPSLSSSLSVVLRFDPQNGAGFADPSSYSVFDVSTLADGGAPTKGFVGGTFDGRYVYLAPFNDGQPDGRIVRYDTQVTPVSDGGARASDAGGDGGDGGGGDAGQGMDASSDASSYVPFVDPAHWASFDFSASDPLATGFTGALFDGTSVYFLPRTNDFYDAGPKNSGIALRYNSVASNFADAGSYTAFDMTTVNSLGTGFLGAAFDGRYVYFVPRANGIVFRFDRTMGSFANKSAWSTYDLTRIVHLDAGANPLFAGATFDGRFVYFVPAGAGFGRAVRYDTASGFGADCAWSVLDLGAFPTSDGGVFQNGLGATFDGQYVYFVPAGNGIFARFAARSPAATFPLPDVPSFNGSFF